MAGGHGPFHVDIFSCIDGIMPQTKKRARGALSYQPEVDDYFLSAFLAGAGLAVVVVLG
jgi:hypothetical protein